VKTVCYVLPDLRYSNTLGDPGFFQKIVRDGLLKETGMVAFVAELSKEQIEAVRAYDVQRAHEQLTQESKEFATRPRGRRVFL
jgi:quinohemoprotein ethanol dehydrogenase